MQFEGGYRYPGNTLWVILTVVVVLVTVLVAYRKSLVLLRALTLFLSFEGTALLVSAFTPTGLAPPQGGLGSRIRWFLRQQGGVPVKFSQPLFYGGLLALFLAILLNVVQ